VAEAEQQKEAEPPIDFEAETEEAIALCDGDVRAALKATLVANAYLESELERIVEMLSAGYGRGLVRKPAQCPTKKAS
jgi:hypothetical protein